MGIGLSVGTKGREKKLPPFEEATQIPVVKRKHFKPVDPLPKGSGNYTEFLLHSNYHKFCILGRIKEILGEVVSKIETSFAYWYAPTAAF